MNIKNFKLNPNNPRVINDQNFKKLVKSIKDFPEMLEKRPIVCVYDDELKLIPLGGNQRLKALMELGYEDIPETYYSIVDDWDEEKQREFIIKDNNNLGDWDYEQLQNWDTTDLENWGLDFEEFDDNDKEKKDRDVSIYQEYQILINCENEIEQQEVYEKIQNLGLNVNIKII